jgi:hypothetical protein
MFGRDDYDVSFILVLYKGKDKKKGKVIPALGHAVA